MGTLTTSGELLVLIQQAVATHQPELSVTATENMIILDGPFVVSGPNGPFDSFQVKVGIARNFPWQEPIVLETGGRIPKTVDRHVFPKDGNCCLGVWEEWILTTPEHTFEAFITGIMHDYFVSQTYFELKGEWPFGERSHGNEGILESFSYVL